MKQLMIKFELLKIQEKLLMIQHLYLLIFSIIIQAFEAILEKFAANSEGTIFFFGIHIETLLLFYVIILGCMGLQVFFWQQALKYYSLSFAYSFRSLVCFIVLFSAYFLFQESITLLNLVGLTIISIGIFYLSKDKEYLK